MKKLIMLGVMLALTIFLGEMAYAASASDDVGILLTVGEKFTFAIGESVVDMGTVAAGGAGNGSVTMYCGSNRKLPWFIKVKSTGLANSQVPGSTISNTYYKCYTYGAGEQAGIGTFMTTPQSFLPFDRLVYTAASSEYSDTDVRVNLGIAVNVPSSQIAGTYAATVTATMTE